jgi:hypothetical protein
MMEKVQRAMKLLGLKPAPVMKENIMPPKPRPPTDRAVMEISQDQKWLMLKKKEMDAVFGEDYATTNPFAFGGYLQACAANRLVEEVKQLRQLLASGEAALTVLNEQPEPIELA